MTQSTMALIGTLVLALTLSKKLEPGRPLSLANAHVVREQPAWRPQIGENDNNQDNRCHGVCATETIDCVVVDCYEGVAGCRDRASKDGFNVPNGEEKSEYHAEA